MSLLDETVRGTKDTVYIGRVRGFEKVPGYE